MILHSPADIPIIDIKEFSSNDNFMGDFTINATIYSESKLVIKAYSYVNHLGDKFYIYPSSKPLETKTAQSGQNIGDAFSYNLTLYSEIKQLENINFYDYIIGVDDSALYYTGNPIVTWYGTVESMINRINANIYRYYGFLKWTISLSPEIDIESLEEKNITASNNTLMEVIKMINDQFNLKYYVSGTSIVIGGDGDTIPESMSYGKGNGFKELKRSFDTSEKIITRVVALGLEGRNLPVGYRENKSTGFIPKNTLLPLSWGSNYIDINWNGNEFFNDIINEYGIIEGSRVYDDIFPSIAGAVDLNNNPLDEVIEIYNIEDDSASFNLKVWYPGFDILANQNTGEIASMSIKAKNKDGNPTSLGGYTFNITGALRSGGYSILTLNRDTTEPTPVPNNSINVNVGDKYVYLGITMDQSYITSAENRLLERAKLDIQDNNGIVVNYIGNPSSIFMENNPSISNLVKSGNNLLVSDTDFGIENLPIKIQNVTIKYGDIIPEYTISLSNIKYKTLLDRINIDNQDQKNINNQIKNSITNVSNNMNIQSGETAVWQII